MRICNFLKIQIIADVDQKFFRFLVCVGVLLSIHTNSFSSNFTIHLDGHHHVHKPENFVGVWIDSSNTMEWKDAQYQEFKLNSVPTLNFGFSNKSIWLKFEITTAASLPEPWILEGANPAVHYMDFYLLDSNGKLIKELSTGSRRSFDKRIIPHKNYMFPLDLLPNGKYQVLVRVRGEDSLGLMMLLGDESFFFQRDYEQQLWIGMFYGLMLVMSVYNLFLFFAIGDKSYLYYVLYILSYAIIQFTISGLGHQFLWKFSPLFASRASITFVGLLVFFSLSFLESFTKSVNKERVYKWIFRFGKCYGLLLTVGVHLLPYAWVLQMTWMFLLFFLIPLIIYLSIRAYNKGYKPARYFLAGWSSLVFGTIIYAVANFGLLPFNFFTIYSGQIGACAEVVLLSFALADRINLLRVEKQLANKQVIAQLKENQSLLKALNEEQNRVFKAVLQGQEQERQRIATELHDGIGQLLSVTKLNLSALEDALVFQDEESKSMYSNAIHLVDESCSEVRNISHNMMPGSLAKLGLTTAIAEMLDKIKTKGNIQAHFQSYGLEKRLPIEIELVVFRVVQELVNNILKHSKAKQFHLQLLLDEQELTLTIEDDGVGFDPLKAGSGNGIGLKNMISRVELIQGKAFIESSEKGTLITITVPIKL